MDWNKLKDSRIKTPDNPGRYMWWSRYLKYIPVKWDGENWRLLNGDMINTVRYWR